MRQPTAIILGAALSWSSGALAAGHGTASEPAMSEQAETGLYVPPPELKGPVPTNNMTQQTVRERFGEPQRQQDPVGEPPIGRWHYPDYVVYFERDRVIISVPSEL